MDENGMADVPMRLLISAVLLSMMVPVMISAYDDLSDRVVQGRIRKEVEVFSAGARSVLDADPGSTVIVTMELEGFGSSRIVSVSFGGPVAGEEMWTSYTMAFETSTSGSSVFAPDPPMQMTNLTGGGPLVVSGVRTDLELVHVVIGGRHCVGIGIS